MKEDGKMKNNKKFDSRNSKQNNFKRKNNKNYKEKSEKRIANNTENETFSDQIEGRNSVLELLETGKDINKIFIERGEKHGSINKIIGIAKDRKIVTV